MQKYHNWCAQTHAHGMLAHDDGQYYLVADVDVQIAQQTLSHHAATAALRSEVTHAQKAIQRMTEELRVLDMRLTGANTTIALFLGPDGEQHIDKFAAAIKSLMVT